jgi:hypothetical protein
MAFKNSKSHFHPVSWCCTFLLVVICAITFIIDLYVNIALSDHHEVRHHHYEKKSPEHVLYKYATQLTPASWLIVVWIIVYVMLIVWFLYIFYLIMCRQLCSRDNKSPLFPSFFWFLFIIINVLNAVWLSLFTHHDMVISGIVLLVLVVMLYVLNMMAYRVCWKEVTYSNDVNDVESYDDDMVELSRCETILLRILTLNALPLYAMWCTIAACLQWSMIFKYSLFHWSDNVSCIISLSVLSLVLLIYWSMCILMKREYFVWTWLPSFALITAIIATLCRHHSVGGLHAPGLFFAFILLLVSGVMTLLHFLTVCLCRPKSPSPRFSRV